MILANFGMAGRRHAFDVEDVFGGIRHAVHRPAPLALGDLGLGRLGLRQRLVGGDDQEGVVVLVDRSDAVEQRLGPFHRRQFFGAQQLRALRDREIGEVGHSSRSKRAGLKTGAGELIDVVPFGNAPSGFSPRSAAAVHAVRIKLQRLRQSMLFGEQPDRIGCFRCITHADRLSRPPAAALAMACCASYIWHTSSAIGEWAAWMRMIQLRAPSAVVVLVGLVRQVDPHVLRRIAEGEHRIDAFLDLLDLAAQHAAEQRDAVVRGAEIFLGAVGDGALRDPRHHVLGVDVVQDVVAVLVLVRDVVGVNLVEQVRRRPSAPSAARRPCTRGAWCGCRPPARGSETRSSAS